MKAWDWNAAFPPVPENVHRRLEQALKQKKEPMKMKKTLRPATVLALTLAVLLALTGAALAAEQLGVLDYLLGRAKPSETLRASVQPAAATETADHIRIELSGVIYDGSRLAFGLTAENLQPDDIAMVTLESVRMNGENVYINFQSMQEQWLPDVFALEPAGQHARNPVTGGMQSIAMDKTYTGRVACEATVVVRRPINGRLVVFDPVMWYDYDEVYGESAPDYRERRDAIRACPSVTVADAWTCLDRNGRDAQAFFEDKCTLVRSDGSFLLEEAGAAQYREQYADDSFGASAHDSHLISRAGQMRETARITLQFEIDADAAQSASHAVAMPDITLSYATVRFERVFVSPLTTAVSMRLYPKSPDGLSALQAMGVPWLVDTQGEMLHSSMEGEGWNAAPENAEYAEICLEWGGLEHTPDALRFAFLFCDNNDAQLNRMRAEFCDKVVIPIP